MTLKMIACKSAKKIFMSAVSAVQPEQLVSAILIKDQDICGQAFVKLNGMYVAIVAISSQQCLLLLVVLLVVTGKL